MTLWRLYGTQTTGIANTTPPGFKRVIPAGINHDQRKGRFSFAQPVCKISQSIRSFLNLPFAASFYINRQQISTGLDLHPMTSEKHHDLIPAIDAVCKRLHRLYHILVIEIMVLDNCEAGCFQLTGHGIRIIDGFLQLAYFLVIIVTDNQRKSALFRG